MILSTRQAEFLLDELCIEYGFCLPPAARAALLLHTPSDPEAFAAAVFKAEGLELDSSNCGLFQDILAHVHRAFDRVKPPAI